MLFFKKKNQEKKVVRQYIGFSTECYDLLTQDERVLYMADLRKGGWEFSLRAVGWIIESRLSDERLSHEELIDVCGAANVRVFTEREVDDLREWVDVFDLCNDEENVQSNIGLRKGFESFVNKIGLLRLPCLHAMKAMYSIATNGEEINEENLTTKPELRGLGNLPMLFGDRLSEVLEAQNNLARKVRQGIPQS